MSPELTCAWFSWFLSPEQKNQSVLEAQAEVQAVDAAYLPALGADQCPLKETFSSLFYPLTGLESLNLDV